MKAAILAVLVAVMMVSLCTSQPSGQPTVTGSGGQEAGGEEPAAEIPVAPVAQAAIEQITITGPLTISQEQCSLRNIVGKMLVIYGPGCAECNYVVGKLEDYEQELGKTVEYISTETDTERIGILKISVDKLYMPAVIIDCKVYTGNMGDRFYKEQMSAL